MRVCKGKRNISKKIRKEVVGRHRRSNRHGLMLERWLLKAQVLEGEEVMVTFALWKTFLAAIRGVHFFETYSRGQPRSRCRKGHWGQGWDSFLF